MPIKLNDTAKALLKTGNAETIRVIRETDSLPMHKCPNCHDTGAIWIQELQGPIGYPSFANVLVTFLGNDCYKIVGNYTYPCPACGDHVRRMSYLWEQSGLLENEHGWKVDYIKGQKGKEEALRTGLDLIAMTPFPRGLYLFYGNYGAGKTGMLKALTAQFTLAGVPARYIRAADILIELRAIYDKTLLLMGLLWRFAWPAILGSVEERERRIAKQLADSEAARAEAQKLLEEHKALIAGSRSEAQEIVAKAKGVAQKEREALVAKGHEEQERLLERARREIGEERDKAIQVLRREAVDLSIAAASRLVVANLDSEANRRLVTDYLASLRTEGH